MAKLLGATTVLVVAALGVAIASLVINILILNQVNNSPDSSPNLDACATPNPSAAPPPPTNNGGISTSDTLTTSPPPDLNDFSNDPKIATSDSLEASTGLTSPPDSDIGVVDTTLRDPVPRPIPYTISGVSAWQEAADRILATTNLSADPCDDFYQFTCGNYLANTNLDGASRKGTSDEAQYQINLDLADYFDSMKLEDLTLKTEQYQKIFLDVCVAEGNTTDPAGEKSKWMDLSQDLDKDLGFPLFPTPSFAVNKDMDHLFAAMGRMERQFTGGPLMTAMVTSDFKDNTKNALYINQPALRFDRDVYVDPQYADKLEQYAADIRDLLLAYSKNTGRRISHNFCPDPIDHRLTDFQCARKAAEWAVDFERTLAIASWSNAELSNYQQQYAAVYWDLGNLYYDYQSVRLDSYVRALLNMEKDEDQFNGFKVVLAQPTYFAALEWKFRVERMTIDEITNYLAIHFLMENAAEYGINIPSHDEFGDRQPTVSKTKIDRYTTRRGHGARRISRPPLNFNGLASTELDAIRVSCIDTLIEYMPFGPGYTYVKNRADRDEALEEVQMMVKYIIDEIGYNEMLRAVDWMDEASLKRASDKGHFYLVKNYLWPEFFGNFQTDAIEIYNKRYTSILDHIKSESTYWKMLKNLKAGFQATEQFDIVSQPGDRSNFLVSPATAAVWYQPERNSITIPFGILNAPYYNSKYPKQYNYAGAGAAIGHEYWRGFDYEGAQFDWQGRLADCSFAGCSILDAQSQQGFNDMAECVVGQYDSKCCPMARGRCVNGEITKRSNLADIGGLQASYFAYSRYASENDQRLPGLEQFTPKQIFWMSYGSSMCTKMTDERLKAQLIASTQTPSSCRVNQVIQDIPQFGKDFMCKYKRGVFAMYPADEDKCSVWVGQETN